jgi:hypothetical protein
VGQEANHILSPWPDFEFVAERHIGFVFGELRVYTCVAPLLRVGLYWRIVGYRLQSHCADASDMFVVD